MLRPLTLWIAQPKNTNKKFAHDAKQFSPVRLVTWATASAIVYRFQTMNGNTWAKCTVIACVFVV
jgi:hypothetical protein